MSDATLIVSSSPHIRKSSSTQRIMLDVIIALVPAMVAAGYFFGLRALLLIGVTVASCVFTEWFSRRFIFKHSNTISDLSAVVTGVLLAFNFPVSLPIPLAIFGGVFAIFFVKQLFGGIGENFMNPAMAARVFLFLAWPALMVGWVAPNADVIAGPTPLAILKGTEAAGASLPSYLDLFLGNRAGCLGETSALALLLGAAYLLARRVIKPTIPVIYLGTVAVMVWIFGDKTQLFHGDVLAHLLSGGLILAAFFMATDYATHPVSTKGIVIYAVGLGLLTALIRLFAVYPEGVSFAIILMNCLTPLIDRHTVPRAFGSAKATKGHKNA